MNPHPMNFGKRNVGFLPKPLQLHSVELISAKKVNMQQEFCANTALASCYRKMHLQFGRPPVPKSHLKRNKKESTNRYADMETT